MSDDLGSEDDYKELRPDFELEEETDVSIDEMLSSDLDGIEDNLDDVNLLNGNLDDFDLGDTIEPVKPEKKKEKKKSAKTGKSKPKSEVPKSRKYAYGKNTVIIGSILSYVFGVLFCYALLEIVTFTNESPNFSIVEKLLMCICSGLFYQVSVSTYLYRAKV